MPGNWAVPGSTTGTGKAAGSELCPRNARFGLAAYRYRERETDYAHGTYRPGNHTPRYAQEPLLGWIFHVERRETPYFLSLRWGEKKRQSPRPWLPGPCSTDSERTHEE